VTAEAYRKTYTKYRWPATCPPCRSPISATRSRCAKFCFLASAGERLQARSCSSRSGSSKLYGQGTCRSRGRGTRVSTVCSGPARSTTRSSSTCSAAIAVAAWEFSARLSFSRAGHSRPRPGGVHHPAARQHDLTRVNAERAPDYGRVDIRVDRTFTVGGSRSTCSPACRT
jgi:hypothetical protein